MKPLRIALAKGRLAELAVDLLKGAGYMVPEDIWKSRKLIFSIPEHGMELVMVKPADVPIYVEYGTADIGVVGKDTLLEEGCSLYEVLDLRFGQCKFALAGLPEEDGMIRRRVATKYPQFTRQLFRERGVPVEVIKLTGSIELAPLTGLADMILDIVETGKTLKENGLVIYEEICPLSARLVVNRVAMKTRRIEINTFIQNLKTQVEGSGTAC